MSKTLRFPGFDVPKITPAEVKRFEAAASIKDPVAFAAELEALIQEKLVSAEQVAADSSSLVDTLGGKARALRADSRWSPSATDIQRGRRAMLRRFEQPQNLPLPEFAKLAHKSRQQIYKDLAAKPRRLLALSVAPAGSDYPTGNLIRSVCALRGRY